MKKAIALSILLTVASTSVVAASPSLAQTVPIIGGSFNIGFSFKGFGQVGQTTISSNVLLTSIGTVSINSDGFNGNLSTRFNSLPIAASSILTFVNIFDIIDSTFFIFEGTTNGISPNGAFTNAPTTINSINERITFSPTPTLLGINIPVTSGSITLNTLDTLRVSSNLSIANSVLSGDFSNRLKDDGQKSRDNEVSDDFSQSAFIDSRIAYLQDK